MLPSGPPPGQVWSQQAASAQCHPQQVMTPPPVAPCSPPPPHSLAMVPASGGTMAMPKPMAAAELAPPPFGGVANQTLEQLVGMLQAANAKGGQKRTQSVPNRQKALSGGHGSQDPPNPKRPRQCNSARFSSGWTTVADLSLFDLRNALGVVNPIECNLMIMDKYDHGDTSLIFQYALGLHGNSKLNCTERCLAVCRTTCKSEHINHQIIDP